MDFPPYANFRSRHDLYPRYPIPKSLSPGKGLTYRPPDKVVSHLRNLSTNKFQVADSPATATICKNNQLSRKDKTGIVSLMFLKSIVFDNISGFCGLRKSLSNQKYSGKASLRLGFATSIRGIITKGLSAIPLCGMVRSSLSILSFP